MDNSFKVRSQNLVLNSLDVKSDYKVRLARHIQNFYRTMPNNRRLFSALGTENVLVIRLSKLIQLLLNVANGYVPNVRCLHLQIRQRRLKKQAFIFRNEQHSKPNENCTAHTCVLTKSGDTYVNSVRKITNVLISFLT